MDVQEALTNDDFAYSVNQDIHEAQNLGIRGVPFFIFNRKYAISGAQPVETFLQTIEKSFAEWQNLNPYSNLKVVGGQQSPTLFAFVASIINLEFILTIF